MDHSIFSTDQNFQMIITKFKFSEDNLKLNHKKAKRNKQGKIKIKSFIITIYRTCNINKINTA